MARQPNRPANDRYQTTRIKLKDNKFNKVKKMVENLVVAHGGSFTDAPTNDGRIKSKYERKIDKKTLRFIYTYHTSISDKNAVRNCRSQLNTHLLKLDIQGRLPSLMVRSSMTYDDDVFAIRKQSKTGRAFIALENAFLAWEEQAEASLLAFSEDGDLDLGKSEDAGNYAPRKNAKPLTVNGVFYATTTELCDAFEVKRNVYYARRRRGWSMEECLGIIPRVKNKP